jgi:hypothetical protein
MGAGDVKKGLGGQIAYLHPRFRWQRRHVDGGLATFCGEGRALLRSNLSALAVPVHAGVGGGLRRPLVPPPAV